MRHRQVFASEAKDIQQSDPVATFLAETSSGAVHTCVLHWVLSSKEHEMGSVERIVNFHEQVRKCVDTFKSVILIDDATSGLILGRPVDKQNMSAEDATLRLGQFLCRWSLQQSPPFGVRCGAHTGGLHTLTLPNSENQVSFFGDAFSKARELAHTAVEENMVHLSKTLKDRLRTLESIPLIITTNRDSYLLEANTLSVDTSATCGINVSMRNSVVADPEDKLVSTLGSTVDRQKMSMDDFRNMLQSKKVDLSAFGKGKAKSLESFFQDVVVDGKSHLVESGTTFERVVPLLRISLRVADALGRDRELRIHATRGRDGVVNTRNQLLALVLTMEESKSWRKAVESCFSDKLRLTQSIQDTCLDVDGSSYITKEERMASETVPGICSVYKSHNVAIRVKHKDSPALHHIGLPGCTEFKTEKGGVEYTWAWNIVGSMSKEDELMNMLLENGVDISEWSANSFARLYSEVFENKSATLEKKDQLIRTMRVIKIWLHASILTHDHVLVMRQKVQNGKSDEADEGKPITMQMVGDDWELNMENALTARLGLTTEQQGKYLNVDESSYRFTEETGNSRSFPGLKTVYLVNEVTVYVNHLENSELRHLGLPDGNDFAFSRDSGAGSGSVVVTYFCWVHASSVRGGKYKPAAVPTFCDRITKVDSKKKVPKRRVVCPSHLEVPSGHESLPLLQRIMKKQKTDWQRARAAAKSIRQPGYSCKNFFDDLTAAFPELRLYVHDSEGGLSSGRSGDDEYQRTIGALFAVYWLMRGDLQGYESFCFGLEDDWLKPRSEHIKMDDATAEEFKRRRAFFDATDWRKIVLLFTEAGLLTTNGAHDPDRTLAMLVLMAVHDIMKVTSLLPVVEDTVKTFHCYQTGDIVSDHDMALGYVLEHHGSWLPSFDGLPQAQKDAVRFTQSKMDYNMGWLVQAEAPPGALFETFKEVIGSGHAKPQDIAFYFVHWFVDLAGAEPFPLEGCEKFVLKFPLKVLQQFLDSFSIVKTLSGPKTETQVFEDYLKWRWHADGTLGALPVGVGSIARMRLVVMAQGDGKAITKAFVQLPLSDREVLSKELALTGLQAQRYSAACGDDITSVGPAILVYYAPALLQKAGKQDPLSAMIVLAEVLRQARVLWPSSEPQAGKRVIVRIDNLKDKDAHTLLQPDSSNMWVLNKTSSADGAVKQIPVSLIGTIDWNTHQVLHFVGTSRSRNMTHKRNDVRRRTS